MKQVSISFVAVLIATFSKQVLGAIWYGPLFGKHWLALTNMTPEQAKQGMIKSIIIDSIASFFMAMVLANTIAHAGGSNIYHGIGIGFWNWLGFILSTHIGYIFFEKLPRKLIVMKLGFQFIGTLIMGAIIAGMV